MTQTTPTSAHADRLLRKIESRDARVAVVGLGYVGLPLAVEFAAAGFNVTGIDLDTNKIKAINSGHSYIKDVEEQAVRAVVDAGKLRAAGDYSPLKDAD